MLPSYTTDPELSQVKLIASDMDLTLLHTDKTMPAGVGERIDALDAAGLTFCAASGRPVATLLEMFAGREDKMAAIGDNGGLVVCRGETVFRDTLDPVLYHEVLAVAEERGGCVPILCCYDEAYALKRDWEYRDELGIYYRNIHYVDSYAEVSAESNKISLLFPNWDSEEECEAIYTPRFADKLNVTCAGKEWIDFMNIGIDKGTGIKRLCDYLGISIADAAALGDTYNDIQMLETVGHSCIVANAEDHMEAHARYRIPSNEDEGVLTYIDAVLETFS